MPAFSTSDFTAVLLAGGKSSRMGQDKAGLMIDGRALWQRQLAKLEAVGAPEVLISGRTNGPYTASAYRIVEDKDPGLGPLGGIVSAFDAARHSTVLVLAIDLPRMSPMFLSSMLSRVPIVPRRGERFEPLAAVYSPPCLNVFRRRLAERQLSMQDAIRELVERGDLAVCDVTAEEAPLFDNLNTPEDLAYFVGTKII
jgi:molybdenum cofactor guanylyltransferase